MNAGDDRRTGRTGTGGVRTARSRLLGATILALSLAAALIGCRRQVIFEGAEMQRATGTVKIAAPAPLCGCANVTNITGQPLRLGAVFNSRTTGSTVLPPGQRLQFRFDWAGPATDDFYVIEGTTESGQHVDLTKALRLQVSQWQDCSTATCSYAPLGMNVGEKAH